MIALPVELQRLCLDPLNDDVDSLKAVRLVNRHLNALASEFLFQTVILGHTDKSAGRFIKVLGSSLKQLIH
jgi:hypothetical protein